MSLCSNQRPSSFHKFPLLILSIFFLMLKKFLKILLSQYFCSGPSFSYLKKVIVIPSHHNNWLLFPIIIRASLRHSWIKASIQFILYYIFIRFFCPFNLFLNVIKIYLKIYIITFKYCFKYLIFKYIIYNFIVQVTPHNMVFKFPLKCRVMLLRVI